MIEAGAWPMNLPRAWPVRSRRHLEEQRLSAEKPAHGRYMPDLNGVLTSVAAGDRSAFAELYDELSPAVFGTVKRIVRSQAHAEDVTQEVFFEVWRKSSDWKPHRGGASIWVLMIARARATDRVRSEQATRNRQERVAPGWLERSGDEVADTVGARHEHEEVRSVLSELSEKQRVVVELAYYEDMSYTEISDSLNLPLGTIKTRMRDGLLRLRDIYGVGQ